jgi:hypothetical protein
LPTLTVIDTSWPNSGVKAMRQIEAHNMSLIQSRYGIPSHCGLLAVVFSALLVFFFNPSMASAQEVKQIRLTEKHMQGFIAVFEDVAQLYDRASQDKPDPKLEAQAEALVKQNGFANLAEYDDVSMNIALIMAGIDPQTKKFTEPPEQIKQQIDAVKSDKSMPEAEKKEDLEQLDTALKSAKPIQFKENIALVRKYYDRLTELMQGQGPAD